MPRLSLATLNHSPLHGLAPRWREHLDAAAEAGFDALAPDVFWLRAIEAEGPGLAALRRELEDRDLDCMEIAGIAIGSRERTAPELEEHRRLCDALGPEFVNARIVDPIDAEVEEQAAACARALFASGARLALEFSRGTQLRSVSETLDFARRTGVEGAGVTLDTWHFFLHPDGPDWAALDALPAEWLANVQLSDGVAYEEGAFMEATMDRRLLPGEGEFDLERFLRAVLEKSSDVGIVAEVLNAEARRDGLAEFARNVQSSCRRSLRAAG